MLNVTTEEVRARYKTLPPKLQEIGVLPETDKFFDSVYEEFRIPAAKIPWVARAAGLVVCGFLRADEFPRELEEGAGLDPLTARAAAKKIQEGYFSKIQSDLDLVYAPPGTTPRPLPPSPSPSFTSSPAPSPSPLPYSSPLSPTPAPVAVSGTTIKPLTKRPGLSASFFPTAPMASSGPAPKPIFNVEATPFTKTTSPLGAPPAGISSAPPAAPAAPPVFLRKEEGGIRPVQTNGIGVRFNFGDLKFQDVKSGGGAPKPARLEIGQSPAAPKPTGPVRAEATPAKVVHYSEWTPTAPKISGQNEDQKPVPLTNLSMPRPADPSRSPAASGPTLTAPSEEEKKAAFLSHITGRAGDSAISSAPPAASPKPVPPTASVPAVPNLPQPQALSHAPAAAPSLPKPPMPSAPVPPGPAAKTPAAGPAPAPPEVVDLGSF